MGAHAYRSRACETSCIAYRGSVLSKMIEMAASAAEHCPSRSEPAHMPIQGLVQEVRLHKPHLLQHDTDFNLAETLGVCWQAQVAVSGSQHQPRAHQDGRGRR